jgi:hypothetical protein
MTEPPRSDPAETRSGEPEGLSAFAARVLNQLSLSAWLPGSVFAAGLTMLVVFRGNRDLDVARAMPDTAPDLWALALLSVPALVLATLLTQAFSFEAIRMLEGYWYRRGPAGWAARHLIRRQARRKQNVAQRRKRLSLKAFDAAVGPWLERESAETIRVLRAQASEEPLPTSLSLTPDQLDHLETLSWDEYCTPWELRQIEGLDMLEREYPEDNRILPTRLGNIIRTAEDRLAGAEDDIETIVLRRRESMPQRVRIQHDQFRVRLDMYCTLALVAVALAVLTPLLLWNVDAGWRGWVGVLVAFWLSLAVVAYHAAVASGRGYAAILRTML